MNINKIKQKTEKYARKVFNKEYKKALKICYKNIKKAYKSGEYSAILPKRYNVNTGYYYNFSNECINKVIETLSNDFEIKDMRNDKHYEICNFYFKIIWKG